MSKFTVKSATKGVVNRPVKMLIYGPPGVGKSTAAANAPSPIFVDLEKGSHRLDVARFPQPSKLEQVYESLESLATEQHEHKTVVVDTIDVLQTLVFDYVCRRDRKKDIDDYGWHKGYGVAHEEWQSLLSRLDIIVDMGMNVILLGHVNVKAFKDPQGHDHDRYEIGVHQSKNAATGTLIKGWCDIVGFANYETVINKDPTTDRIKVTDTGKRLLYIRRERGYDAKSRWDFGASKIELDGNKLFESIKKQMSETGKKE